MPLTSCNAWESMLFSLVSRAELALVTEVCWWGGELTGGLTSSDVSLHSLRTLKWPIQKPTILSNC